MRKTFLAVTLATLLVAPTMAAAQTMLGETTNALADNKVIMTNNNWKPNNDVINGGATADASVVSEAWAKEQFKTALSDGQLEYLPTTGMIVDNTGLTVGEVVEYEDGSYKVIEFKDHDRNDGKELEIANVVEFTKREDGKLDVKVDDTSNWKPTPPPEYHDYVIDRSELTGQVTDFMNENNLVANDAGHVFDENGEQVANIIVDEEGNVAVEVFGDNDTNTKIAFKDIGEDKVSIETKETKNEAGKNGGGVTPEHDAVWEEINKIKAAGGDAAIAGGKAYEQALADYNNLDGRIKSNTARITGLETEMKKMGDKMLDLEDRMDGVVATSHAVTNARPMVQDAGEFAMGVGIGAAGSKQALALGGAYQFSQNWSASTTVNYETAGKRSKSQFSAGAGVHYRFK